MAVLSPGDIDVLILCGGAGTRLRPVVSDRPKPMAAICDRPFLDILIDHAAGFGYRRFILCTGYMKDAISAYYIKNAGGLEILFSEEDSPLGTGGAVRHAGGLIRSGSFLVMNGDSFCPMDLRDFLKVHQERDAWISMALSRVVDAGDYGVVECDSSGMVVSFHEKGRRSEGLVNAGVYMMRKEVLDDIPSGVCHSLELDLFPAYVRRRFYGFITGSCFTDIGTPERYASACRMFSEKRKGRSEDD